MKVQSCLTLCTKISYMQFCDKKYDKWHALLIAPQIGKPYNL